ncbi:3185_t:CDS:2, partial [Racocetra persica]
MSDNVASSSSFTSAPTASLPTTEEINGLSRDEVKGFLQGRRVELDLEDDDINIIYNQRVKGDTFLDFNAVDFERWGIPGAPAKKLERLIKQIKGGRVCKFFLVQTMPYSPIIPNTYIILCFAFLLLTVKPAKKHNCVIVEQSGAVLIMKRLIYNLVLFFTLLLLTLKKNPKNTIHVEVRKKITDVFPGGLPYMKPEPLLRTSGANWEYQPDPSLKQILREALKKHYKNFTLGRIDKKSDLPIYLFLSGAGTGKSRNANEFHQTAITCLSTQEDRELLTRIKEAWVFHVSYENGFSLKQEESNPYLAIGTRMLFQLLREKMDLYEIIETYNPPNPMDVVKLIAKHYNRDLKSATIILVVDGMQQLMENKDDGLKLNSTFYKTLTSFADLAFSGTFIIPVCTSTITGPIDGTLRYSSTELKIASR